LRQESLIRKKSILILFMKSEKSIWSLHFFFWKFLFYYSWNQPIWIQM
jgi:hypothetical protein